MTTLANCSAKIIALIHILRDEAKFLRSGKLANVAGVIETKTKAMRDVENAISTVDSPETLVQLRSHLVALDKMGKENSRLLQSVLAGARAARARIDILSSQEAQVGTYDVRGRKHRLSGIVKSSNKLV